MNHDRLQQVQGQHRDFLALAVGAGQFGVFAVVDVAVPRVPLLDDLEALVDLLAQCRVAQVVGQEYGPAGSAELHQGGVDRVLWAGPSETPEYLFGLGGLQAEGGGVLDHLVVRWRT